MVLGVIFWVFLFVMALAVLVKSSDYFVRSASRIGLFFGMPAFLIGVTIVAIGTSFPELISSIISVIEGASEIVTGNVVGANITNIFLILGIGAVIGRKLKSTYGVVHVDLPMLAGAAFLFTFIIWDTKVTLFESLLLIVVIILYLIYAVNVRKKHPEEGTRLKAPKGVREEFPKKELFILIISLVLIFVGAKYTIDSIINLSQLLGIGKEIIAASVLSLGTTLPELMVTVSAARKGKSEMAIGNILGSNIFNMLGVVGVAGLFGTIAVAQSILMFALPFMVGAILLYVFVALDNEITKWEGGLFLILYVFYISRLFFV